MRKISLMALNDLRLTARDRSSFIWMLIMPIAFMWFFGQMGGGGSSGPPQIALGVLDLDGGWLARAVVEELQDDQITLEEIDPQAGAGARGQVRTLVIPEGFTSKVLSGEQQELRLEKDPDANEEFSLAAEVHVIRTVVRTLARMVEMDSKDGLDAETDDVTAAKRFGELGDREPLVHLAVSTAGQGRPVPRGFAQSVPGMLTMMVLMMTVIYGGVFLTIEKREGMLRRQISLPVSRRHIFIGKFLGRLLMAGLQIVVLILAGRFVFGLTITGSPIGLALLLFCYAVSVAALATMLGAVLSSPEYASSIGWILSMVLSAMGGCWWPSESMPSWLWTAAHVLPTAWAMDAFHALISFGRGVEAVLLPCAVLMGFGLVFSAVGARYLKTSA